MLGKEMVTVAKPIALTNKQKLNIEVLSYHQAVKEEIYTAETIYNLWPTSGSEDLLNRAGPRPSITAIQQYQLGDDYRNGMSDRGIEIDPNVGQMTAEQLACVRLLTNPMDRRTPRGKLQALGIPYSKYAGWLKQKPFNDAIRGIAGRGLEEAIPLAEVALSASASNGDLPSIKFLMEVTGRYNPQQQQAVDAQALIAVMVDAAQEVLGNDPEKLRQYTDIVRLKAQSIKGVVL